MQNIVVPVDFSDQTDAVLELARLFGEAFSAHIWLLHIAAPEPEFVGYEPGPDCVRDQVAKGLRGEHQQVQQLARQLAGQGIEVTALAIQGPTIEKILAELQKLAADLVIMGSHGRGAIYRTLLGSVSEGVLHGAACPVLIIPPLDRAHRQGSEDAGSDRTASATADTENGDTLADTTELR